MGTCVNCGSKFIKAKSRYYRYSLEKCVLKTRTLREVLMDNFDFEVITPLSKSSTPIEDRCLCLACYHYVEKIERRRLELSTKQKEIEIFKETFLSQSSPRSYLSFKRRETDRASGEEWKPKKTCTCFRTPPIISPIIGAIIRPPPEKRPKIDNDISEPSVSAGNGPIKTRRSKVLKRKAINYIHGSQYKFGFKLLITKSPVAKKHFLLLLQSMVRKEMSTFIKTSEYGHKTFTEETSMETFDWGEFVENIKTGLPLFHTVLESFITRREMVDDVKIDEDGNIGSLIPGLGLVLAILLRLRRPKKFNLVQSIISVELYRQIRSQKLLTSLYKLGLCMSPTATRTLINKFKPVEKAPDTNKKSSPENVEAGGFVQLEKSNYAETAHTTMFNSCTEEEVAASQIEEEVMEFAEWSINVNEKPDT